jgi:two-component system OmpR family sensor kinase
MSVTASWLRRHRLETSWAVFAALNVAAMGLLAGRDGGTVPFHFIWVSLTLVYGYTVWNIKPTAIVLTVVMVTTAAMIVLEIILGPTRPDELTEVPLMAAMFAAIVWHARRRLAAEHEAVRLREQARAFIRDSSHHLKTPLQVARAYAELTRRSRLDPATRRDVDRLIGELDRLTKIVNGLLLFMTVGHHADLIERRPLDLEALLMGVTSRWMDAVERRWTVEVETPGTLLGDADRLATALDALIENAVDATSDGGSIAVRTRCLGSTVAIEVADDGHGVRPEDAARVFERFWTGSNGDGRGTGLGLAIVEAIVDAHGGDIALGSDEGCTVFTVTLGPFTADRPRLDVPPYGDGYARASLGPERKELVGGSDGTRQ